MNMMVEEIERLTHLKRDPAKWQEWYSNITEIITYNYNTYINNLRKLVRIIHPRQDKHQGGLRKAR